VLTHPTAVQLGGFRWRSQVVGDHVITGWEVLGAPVSVQIVGDEIQVEYDPAFAMDGSPVAANTFNGAYHNYTAPVAMLNGGVTPIDAFSWGRVKALYR
jgi:hypothetical protein